MIIAGYCVAALVVLGLAYGLIRQFTDWLGHPEHYEEFEHRHHEPSPGPAVSPAQTYKVGGETYLKAPFVKRVLNVTQSCVDLNEILYVSLNAENFPRLEELRFISANEAVLPEEDAVLGMNVQGEAKAYPIRMLNYHVVLNDICGGSEIAVVWDPLTMTPKVLRRTIQRTDGAPLPLTFALLGLLHRGGLLLYDEATGSVWSPPQVKCLAGALRGTVLNEYPLLFVSWKVWKGRYPSTAVLSSETPYGHKYFRDLYASYYARPELAIPVEGWDAEKSPFNWSEPCIVIEAEGKARAYPLSVIATSKQNIRDSFAGINVVIHEPQSRIPFPTDEQGREILYSFGAWFLWSVQYPDIEVFSPGKKPQ